MHTHAAHGEILNQYPNVQSQPKKARQRGLKQHKLKYDHISHAHAHAHIRACTYQSMKRNQNGDIRSFPFAQFFQADPITEKKDDDGKFPATLRLKAPTLLPPTLPPTAMLSSAAPYRAQIKDAQKLAISSPCRSPDPPFSSLSPFAMRSEQLQTAKTKDA